MSPDAPKPLMEDLASLVDGVEAVDAKSAPLPTMAEVSEASAPRKVLRFQRSRKLISSTFLGGIHNRGGAIDFYERLAWKRGDGNTGAGRATVWKISFKDFVEAVVVVEFGEKKGERQNAV